MSDARFAAGQHAVRTVDILPVDVQLWTYPGAPWDPEVVAEGLDEMLGTIVEAELAQRGYAVGARLDWGGHFPMGGARGRAMSEEDVALTAVALSSFGSAQEQFTAQGGQGTLLPHLPIRLGQATRSDTTLYVGGWAYAGKDDERSTGSKVALGVLAGALILGLVIMVVSGKGGGDGLGKIAGGVARGGAAVAKGVARTAGGFGRVAARVITSSARGAMRAGLVISREGPRIAIETLDAFGRAGFDTHIVIHPGRPDYAHSPKTPRKGPSSMFIEMTLVDNASGQTLWHARKRFPASPRKAKHVQKLVERMFASLPASEGGPPGLALTNH